MVQVLCVCLGNICRSPTAEAVLRARAEKAGLGQVLRVDSAGTSAFHVNEPPDKRARAKALERGYDLSDIRARRFSATDFQVFDYILAMDASNQAELLNQCPGSERHKVELFMRYHPDSDLDQVPDPYFGGEDGFERVLDLIEAASDGFIKHLQNTHYAR